MNYRNRGFEFSLASPSDSDEILELFEDMEFTGDISVLFTRRPDPYKSIVSEGEKAVIPIVKDIENNTICAMGCCIIRKAFINGEVKNAGYLTGLKIRKEYKSLIYLIKDVYKFLYEETKNEVDLYYTTILEDNKSAQKLLEKKRKNMPEYYYEGDYVVYCFSGKSPSLKTKNEDFNGYKFEQGNNPELKQFYRENLQKYNFSPNDINLYKLNDDDFFSLKDENGNIVAACALWNQNDYKQYIITRYSNIFKYISKLPTGILGYPSFPKENIPINYASISLFIVKDMNLHTADYFLSKVRSHNRKYDLLMLGLFQPHPLNMTFEKIKHIKYKSRFYRVSWEQDIPELDEKPLNVEVGLL